MSWLDAFEKRFRPFALPGVTLYLIAGQTICFILGLSKPALYGQIALIPTDVFAGEVWRLVTFLFIPPANSALFAFIAWYLFYLMGDALEHQWGVARYNLFLLIAYVATILASLLTPTVPSTNVFIGTSVFLAFAYLFPDFQLYLFFILPVKVKWLALLTWVGYLYVLVFGATWSARLLVLASVSNFLLFFGREMAMAVRAKSHSLARQAEQIRRETEVVHRCVVCGVTDKDDPQREFRYCSICAGTPCYCGEHIREHEHRR